MLLRGRDASGRALVVASNESPDARVAENISTRREECVVLASLVAQETEVLQLLSFDLKSQDKRCRVRIREEASTTDRKSSTTHA